MSHTKEPWVFGSHGQIIGSGGRGDTVCMMVDEEIIEANARRIVACVNACAGSSTKWLEFVTSEDYADEFGKPVPFETRHGEILSTALGIMVDRDKLKVQRDELLAALQDVIAISDRKHDAWDRAKAAIAAVKGLNAPSSGAATGE